MRERKNNTVGGHGGIVQVRREGEKGTEIRVAWQKWSLYSKCSSVTKVSDPALCGAFHFPGARNRARAEGVCVLAHVCVIVCLRCPCDPSLDTHTHTHAQAHTHSDSLCWQEHDGTLRLEQGARNTNTAH